MPVFPRRRLAVILALLGGGALRLGASPREVTLLHVNDVHGYIEAQPGGAGQRGGMALLAAALEEERRRARERGGASIFLCAGDLFRGTAVTDLTRGGCMVELMNELGLDLLTLGNHEFDYGLVNLSVQLRKARFGILGSNVEAPAFFSKPLQRDVLRDLGGVRTGFFGLIVQDVPAVSSATRFHGTRFTDPLVEARKRVRSLKARGAQLIVALSHVGYHEEVDLASRLEGLHVIVGGHSHTALAEPRVVEPTGVLVVQAGCYNHYLGLLTVVFDPRTDRVLGHHGRLIPLESPPLGPDPRMAARVAALTAPVKARLDEVLGQAGDEIGHGVRGGASPATELVAEAFRWRAGARIGLVNFGGVRRGLPAGPITHELLYELLPFGNRLMRVELRGAVLHAMLERSVGGPWVPPVSAGGPAGGLRPGHKQLGFLVGSGLSYRFDPRLPEGERLLEVRTAGGPLEPDRSYTVALTDFLARGGDGFHELTGAAGQALVGPLDREALLEYLKEHSPVRPSPVPSVVNLSFPGEAVPLQQTKKTLSPKSL